MSSAKSFHETFYGTPTEDETRRRRGKKRHNKSAKEEPQNEVAVIGVHYRSFDDDSLAAFVNSATALVPWNGDPKLLIDRYDVRHLLQDLTGIRRRRARPPSPDATKEELDYERYRDVEGLENPSSPEDELKNEDVTGGGYQRVGFDYGTSGDQETRKERVEDALFSPPFFVPEHLRLQIPTSTKVHQIMAGTAKYVIEHGGQAEIVLRVKQANNSTFGFLMPDHQDHEYFRFLVAHPEHVGIGPTSQQAAVPEVAAPASEEAGGGLSLLGTAYGDADEDEEEGEGSEACKDQAEEPLLVAKEDLEEVNTVTNLPIDGSTEHGATSKRSSTIDLITSDVVEDATKDTGDSLEVSLGSEFPESALQSGEVQTDGLVDASPGSRGPVPPGMEAGSSGSGEMEGHESQGHSGDLDHQVVPHYKEPPLQLRLIINKMVEYISRNGKEFEAIVKERDKTDHRFPFFLPWNEYHPYYAKELESARQARLSADTEATSIPTTSDPLNSQQGEKAAEKDEGTGSFLNGVPFWDTAQAVGSSGVNGEGEMSNMPECEEDQSHNGEGGMGFDAVMAAVRFATRGRPQPVEGNQESDLLKVSDGDVRLGIGSDEAVLAAIRAATGRTKFDSSKVVDKEDIPGSNAPDVKDGRDLTQTSTVSRVAALSDTKDTQNSTLSRKTSVGDSSDPIRTATPPPQSSAETIVRLDEDHAVVPHLVTKAPAVSLVEERVSAEPQLTTPERRRAERLKKAKLFAAMIKDKNGSFIDAGQLSGSIGISAPKLDRLNQVFVDLESTAGNVPTATIDAEPETRNQTADTQVRVATEGDKDLADSSVKQRKHKAKSKEEDERKRKHRQKRKKDMGEKENGREHSPGPGGRREDKRHDLYQDGRRKESKSDPEPEGRARNSKRGLSEGKSRVDNGFQDLADRKEEHEEPRKDRSHYTNDSERRKESRYEAEQKRRRDRQEHDSEWTRKGSRHERDSEDERREDRQKHDRSRHGYDSEDERRTDRQKHNKTRHGYDSEEERRADRQKRDISRHQYDSEEERRRDRKKHDKIRHGHDFEEERRRDRQEDKDRKRRSRHDSEEKRIGDKYEYGSDDMRKEESQRHGKRKKNSDRADGNDQDGRRDDYRAKKSRQHKDDFDSSTFSTHVDRQDAHHQDMTDDRKIDVVNPVKQDVPPQKNVSQKRVGEEKPSLSSADVPDDIRAKVRAMLALM